MTTTNIICIVFLGMWTLFLGMWTLFFRGNKKNTPQQVSLDKDTIIDSIEESFAISDAVQRKTNDYISSRLSHLNEAAEEAKKAFSNFLPSRFSAEVRSDPSYFADGDDFDALQKTIINDGIELARSFESKQGLKLILSEDDVARFKLTLDDNGVITGKVSASQVFELIERKSQGTELFADQSSLEICQKEQEVKKLIEEITNSSSGNGNIKIEQTSISLNESHPSSPLSDVEQLIKDSIALQMDNATSPENSVKFGVSKRAVERDVIEATKSFALTGGPADVTAYHDFYDLQIAFKHVWTEVFDKKLARQAESIYSELVTYQNEVGAKSDVEAVTSIEQLRRVMDDIRKASAQIAGADPRLVEVIKKYPELTPEIWASLDPSTKGAIYSLATESRILETTSNSAQEKVSGRKIYGNRVDVSAIVKAAQLQSNKLSRIEKMLKDLEERLSEKYSFDVFYADPQKNKYSMNYGILVDYRQKWKPLNYQVGELVSTIPLAPKEIQKYSKKRVVRKNRATKEIENSLQVRNEESSDKARVQAEIVRRATNKTNFKQNAEGGVNFAVWNAKASQSMEIDAAKQSAQTKKQFRENVLKAAEEYKQEHRLEISTTSSDEFEETTSGEISNPNDELSVTYLFYELQRRYEISEKIRKLTPVILIANEVPRPDEIDEDWLLAHDWILKRVILDDSFLLALDYLKESFVGDEISTEVMRTNLSTQIEVVAKVTQQIQINSGVLGVAQTALEEAIEEYARTQQEDSPGLFEVIGDFFTGGDDDLSETNRIRMEAAREAFQRAERQQRELRFQLERDITALQVATDKYAQALQEQFNRRTEILRLRAHVKDNILYYMYAIWDQEPPDQRFFRLYNIDVFDIGGEGIQAVPVPLKIDTINGIRQTLGSFGGRANIQFDFIPTIKVTPKKLVEVADLDNLLGYKGNYMIFPLKKNNPITLYMMQDYINIEDTVRLGDPDELGNYTSEELVEFMKCVYRKNPEAFDHDFKNKIQQLLIKRLTNPNREKDEVVVPTDSLYIEALPGKHPILEDFKLAHRGVDVKKVQAEVRHDELENIRLAARVIQGEYDDPDIEKQIVIEGDTDDVAISTDS